MLNLAGSDTLATQLIDGAPVDLFFGADQVQMDRVADEGRIIRETRVELLANRLAVVVPADRGGFGDACRRPGVASHRAYRRGRPRGRSRGCLRKGVS